MTRDRVTGRSASSEYPVTPQRFVWRGLDPRTSCLIGKPRIQFELNGEDDFKIVEGIFDARRLLLARAETLIAFE
jgi:hypothetical protein